VRWTFLPGCGAGILFCEVKSVDGFHYTLTAWKTKKDLQKFVLSLIHRKAMKTFPKIATGTTTGYEIDKMLAWNEALLMWRKQQPITIDF
jgi:hypothetical protein